MKGKVDLYELLKVDRSVAPNDMRKAYYAMARKVHPDKNPGDPTAEETFKALQQAYEILKDPLKRKQYDRTGRVDGGSSFWEAYQKYKSVEISTEDIDEFCDMYRESEEETADVVDYFRRFKGDVTNILGSIMGSVDADRSRFVKILEKAISTKEITAKKSIKTFNKCKSHILSSEELDTLEGEDLKSEQDEDSVESGDEDMNDFIAQEGEPQIEAEESGGETSEFSLGDEIRARWKKGAHWYDGIITGVQGTMYQVTYSDDGFVEDKVKASMIKKLSGNKRKRAVKTPVNGKDRKAKKNSDETEALSKRAAKEKKQNKNSVAKEDVSKRATEEKRPKKNSDYDGDMDALRAAMLGSNRVQARQDAFSTFEEKWKGK